MNQLLYVAAAAADKLPHATLGGGELQKILQFVFGFAGALALLMVSLGAFKYTISRGDPNAIKSAKETIIYALVGLIISISAYGIVTFVLGHLV